MVEYSGNIRQPLLDSRKLLAFATLARCGSFSNTARELFLTQSAVSHAIKSLEDELGCRLFDRRGRRAQLTESGRHLLAHAARILDEMQLARADLKALDRPEARRLFEPRQKIAGR